MNVVLFGLGTIGAAVKQTLEAHRHDVVTVSRERGQFRADLTDVESLRTVFERVGTFHAVACAAGDVFPGPLEQATDEQWAKSFASKAMGQINVFRAAIPFIADKGSFTLISGILSDEPIAGGVIGEIACDRRLFGDHQHAARSARQSDLPAGTSARNPCGASPAFACEPALRRLRAPEADGIAHLGPQSCWRGRCGRKAEFSKALSHEERRMRSQ